MSTSHAFPPEQLEAAREHWPEKADIDDPSMVEWLQGVHAEPWTDLEIRGWHRRELLRNLPYSISRHEKEVDAAQDADAENYWLRWNRLQDLRVLLKDVQVRPLQTAVRDLQDAHKVLEDIIDLFERHRDMQDWAVLSTHYRLRGTMRIPRG